jgi:hypothetical protein
MTIFAALGLATAVSWLRGVAVLAFAFSSPRRAGITTGVVLALAVCAAAVETRHAQPYGLSHYNALAGGAPGGADLGMNRQFWGYSIKGVLPFLNDRESDAGKLYFHDAWPRAMDKYRKTKELATTFGNAGGERHGIRGSKWAVVIHELHFNRHDYIIWSEYGTIQPVYVLRVDGVPIVSLYRNPKK